MQSVDVRKTRTDPTPRGSWDDFTETVIYRKTPPIFYLEALKSLLPFQKNPAHWVRIHRWFNRMAWRRARASNGRGILIAASICWPFRLFYLAVYDKTIKQHRKRVRKQTGKSYLKQRLEILYLGIVHSIPPRTYFLFRLFEPERRAIANRYLHRFETKHGLFSFIYRNLGKPSKGMTLSDKGEFAARCNENGLPTPAIFVALENGVIEAREWKEEGLPKVDLIVKRTIGRGGHRMMRWEFIGNDQYRSAKGKILDTEKLISLLKDESKTNSLLVMKRMRNHHAIKNLSGAKADVLTTVRMVTGINEQGEPELVSSTFKIGVKQKIADNVHFGGLAAPVDVETGELGFGVSTEPLKQPVEPHPTTGAPIRGRKLPLWEEARDLVKRAHVAVPEMLFIGWDVGLTEDGPVLIEGNSATCVHLQQTPHRAPLGAGRCGELMAHQLDRIDPKTAIYAQQSE